jgi:hypothetical protein
MLKTVISKVTYVLLSEIIRTNNNNPLTTSLHLYIFYTYIYNLSTLVSNSIPNFDGFGIPDWYIPTKTYIHQLQIDKSNLLDNLVFYGAQSMLQLLYGNNLLTGQTIKNMYNINESNVITTLQYCINSWAQVHYDSRESLLKSPILAQNDVNIDTGFKVDVNRQNNIVTDPTKWIELIVPTGLLKNDDGNPIIDKLNPNSYKIQRELGPNWGNEKGFSITNLNTNFNLLTKLLS